MLFSTQNHILVETFGLDRGNDILIDAGFPAIDMSFFSPVENLFGSDCKNKAKELRKALNDRGVIFNQAHAPFGGGYEYYTENTVPKLPRVFELCGILGVKQVVVHPLQKGRYYGNEKELFALNMDFYGKLAGPAKDCGVKIAIENMWQRHPVTGHICDDVCADPAELAAYYDTLNDGDAFTVCLDIGHVALCGREPANAIKFLGKRRLGALHVHDVDYLEDCHTLPGVEKIDWNSVCSALAEIDYGGEFTLEADNFLTHYDNEFKPVAAHFMADTARYLANKIDLLRK